MRVLVLGASGMIGRSLFRLLSQEPELQVFGTMRSKSKLENHEEKIFLNVELTNLDCLISLYNKIKPDVVINCVGITKHVPESSDPIASLTLNALLPHRLAQISEAFGARLIHISTDCVFSGNAGNYKEKDFTDAVDIYGRTKAMGEVFGDNVVTLRTSTIGHEFESCYGLLEWFLTQQQCRGYKRAIFSGLPTFELAQIIKKYVIPNVKLNGLFNVGASPICKYTLLKLISNVYEKNIIISADEEFRVDRSLNVDKFTNATGYRAPEWPELIEAMYLDHLSRK